MDPIQYLFKKISQSSPWKVAELTLLYGILENISWCIITFYNYYYYF